MLKKTTAPSHQVSSLFVGRWQPFHAGHQALLETVLKQGKPVVIGIRDTELSQKNPYTVHERWSMIQKALHQYGELVKIIVIPDIDEICYGREVGYAIRKIDLDANTEQISGTKTRQANPPLHPILWLTGQSGAGKSTLAQTLREKIPAVILDGDEMRASISLGAGFSKDDREEHNLRVARLAITLAKQSLVIVSVIAPFQETREKITQLINPVWIHIDRTLPQDKNKPYEPPDQPALKLNSDHQDPEQQAQLVLELLDAGK